MDYSVLVTFVDGYPDRNEPTALQKGRSLKNKGVLTDNALSAKIYPVKFRHTYLII